MMIRRNGQRIRGSKISVHMLARQLKLRGCRNQDYRVSVRECIAVSGMPGQIHRQAHARPAGERRHRRPQHEAQRRAKVLSQHQRVLGTWHFGTWAAALQVSLTSKFAVVT